MNIGVIGGGPAGIISALEAIKNNHSVKLFDANPVIGRKLSITGAGRGNLTNLELNPTRYFCQNSENFNSLNRLLSKYNSNFLVNYFKEIGIPTYHTDDGWVYPVSNSAKNLSSFFETLLFESGIEIFNNTSINSLTIQNNRVKIKAENRPAWFFDQVIIATGGKAYPQIGASTTIIESLQQYGYIIHPMIPALAPVKTSKKQTSLLKGQRFNADLKLSDSKNVITKEYGNIIFTEWGINGPGVMNLSHYCQSANKNLSLIINPMIQFKDTLLQTIQNHPNRNLPFSTILLPFIPLSLIEQYQKNKHRFINKPIKELVQIDAESLMASFDLHETVLGTRGFEFSQVSSGGIDLSQVNLDTMKSTLHHTLSFCGEVLDIVGPCGGYNLHWAFISGFIAGKNI